MIFQTENELDESLYTIVTQFDIRVFVMSLDEPNRDPYQRLKNLRPIPTAFAAFGTAKELSNLLGAASQQKLVSRHSRWNLFVEDFASPDLNTETANVDIVIASMALSNCCKMQNLAENCQCESGIKPKQMIAKQTGMILSKISSQ